MSKIRTSAGIDENFLLLLFERFVACPGCESQPKSLHRSSREIFLLVFRFTKLGGGSAGKLARGLNRRIGI